MKLDRNIPSNEGRGKYALLLLRKLPASGARTSWAAPIWDAIRLLEREGVIDWGNHGSESEFFVMRLKDRYAGAGLDGYANAASLDDLEYAEEVREMANRAGPYHPACKNPD
jgi:hypothetical protein